MICYKCDKCGDLHYDIGEMNNVKISYAGHANVTFSNEGEYLVCDKCGYEIIKLLNTTRRKIEENNETETELKVAPVQLNEKPKAEKTAKVKRKVVIDIGKAKALRAAGWSYEKIAEEFGCSTQTIINHMKANMVKQEKENNGL